MKKIIVRCTYDLELEVPVDEEDGYDAVFDIEENHCPGTGSVGAALEKLRKEAEEKSCCWACPTGKNEIIFDSQYEDTNEK